MAGLTISIVGSFYQNRAPIFVDLQYTQNVGKSDTNPFKTDN